MKKIVVATGNKEKLNEIREIFSDYEVLSIKDFSISLDIEEDQPTFEGNALKKATEYSLALGTACIADDSGIQIKALGDFPGVKTARWMQGTDKDRNIGILEKLKDIPKEKRLCDFVTAIALVDTLHNVEIVKVHTIRGTISTELRGTNGFGFDEIFELEDGRTIAELSSEEKNSLSPRKMALEDIRNEILKI